jgi:uncharacterized membrane protein YoaK (UPF0700 family)
VAALGVRLCCGDVDGSVRSSGAAERTTAFGRLIADPVHGPLPALMLLLTVLTGVVDAVSILSLGGVFVANMTGNLVFIGFAIAGAPAISLSASVSALVGFIVGAVIGGAAIARLSWHRGRLMVVVTAGELVLVLLALAESAVAGRHPGTGPREAIAATLALAMGAQIATVRHLKVFDLATMAVTMALTGIVAEIRRGDRFDLVRRALAVVAIVCGAIAGGLLVLKVSNAAALGLAAALLAIVAVGAFLASRSPAPWHSSGS